MDWEKDLFIFPNKNLHEAFSSIQPSNLPVPKEFKQEHIKIWIHNSENHWVLRAETNISIYRHPIQNTAVSIWVHLQLYIQYKKNLFVSSASKLKGFVLMLNSGHWSIKGSKIEPWRIPCCMWMQFTSILFLALFKIWCIIVNPVKSFG